MNTTRAAVLHAPLKLSIEELVVPEVVRDDGALLDVEVTGVCGADIEMFAGKSLTNFDPVVLGHEVVGRVRLIGPSAGSRWGLKVGDRVVINEVIPCGRCRLCSGGRGELCNGFFGTDGSRYGNIPVAQGTGLWGGYSSIMELHPDTQLCPISDVVPTQVASMFMPVSNGVHWLFQIAQLRPGESVLVVGPGPQGLAVTAVGSLAKLDVIVAGRSSDAERLSLAARVGAARTIDVETENVADAVLESTGGVGVDAVVIATGGADSIMAMATRCVRIGGTIVMAGTNGWKSEQRFKTDALVFRDITVRGAPGHSMRSIEQAVSLLESGWETFLPLAGEELPLSRVVEALNRPPSMSPNGGVHTSIRPDL